MGWSIGYDSHWRRDIGYGVPAECDHPACHERIDRGLAYVCGDEPCGGDEGCGLYFCGAHLFSAARCNQLCERCLKRRRPFAAKPDVAEWMRWKLTDESWSRWREKYPDEAKALALSLSALQPEAIPAPSGE